MKKRFTDVDKWRKRWWRELMPLEKLAWYYLTEECDNVGVWDVDLERAEWLIGGKIDWEALIAKVNGNIVVLNERKWWLVDFCKFQYNILDENSGSPPVLSHIRLLKQHGLWERYLKTIESLYKDLKTRKRKEQEYIKPSTRKRQEQEEIRRTISRENKSREYRR